MKKLNRNGFLLYELFIAFTFIIIIMIVMLQTTITIKNQQQRALAKSEMTSFKLDLKRSLAIDLENYYVESVTGDPGSSYVSSGTSLITLVLKSKTSSTTINKTLQLNTTNQNITYDGNVYNLNTEKATLQDIKIRKVKIGNFYSYNILFDFTDDALNFTLSNFLKVPFLKNNTGVSVANADLNSIVTTKTLVRDTSGNLHLVYGSDITAVRKGSYISSTDNGLTWSAPYVFPAAGNAATRMGLPWINIGRSNTLHVFLQGSLPDNIGISNYTKPASGNWSGETVIGYAHSSSDEAYAYPNPGVDSSGNFFLAYSRTHISGLRYKIWDGSTWGAYVAVGTPSLDLTYETAHVYNGVYYTFSTVGSNLYFHRTVSGTWQAPVIVSTYTTPSVRSEVITKNGYLWLFMVNSGNTPNSIVAKKFNLSTLAWDGAWTTIDVGDAGAKHANYPTATVDENGNIYLFYHMYNGTNAYEIFYKVYDVVAGTWSARKQLTNSTDDGNTAYPNARYQDNLHYYPKKVELTYRQNPIGDTSSYKLYHAVINN